jgi:sugar lactone lactonase YvrE
MLIVVLLVAPAALAQDGGSLPEQIVVQREGMFPEGIEYDEVGQRFLLGSLSEGSIFTVQDDGTVTPFIEDTDLKATTGIHIDEVNGRLLVPSSDPAVLQGGEQGDPAITLAAYDLETGERIFLADLSAAAPEGSHFANDLAVDTAGNAYVTDSFAPIIYRVDLEGNVSIFVQDDRFSSDQFGLNGIEFHPDGYLLVGKSDTGSLFKIPLTNPVTPVEVQLDSPVSGVDGMVLHPNGDLFVVGQPQTVFRVHSDDDWTTATLVDQVQTESQATTATIRQGEVFVIFAHLDAMGSDTPPAAFEIVHVPFAGLSEAGEEAIVPTAEVETDSSTEEIAPAATEDIQY